MKKQLTTAEKIERAAQLGERAGRTFREVMDGVIQSANWHEPENPNNDKLTTVQIEQDGSITMSKSSGKA